MRSIRILLARQDPAYLAEYALGLVPKPFHRQWQRICTEHKHASIIAPTEFGKTATILLARSLWEIGNNPDLRIALISNTAEMPIEVLGRIKDNIEFNPLLHEVFPGLVPKMRGRRPVLWHHNKIRVQRSPGVDFTMKEPSIQALGLGGRVSGARLDLVIMDDTVWWDNALTPGGRKKIKSWFLGVILGRMTARGRIWIINNAWDEEDLIHWLEKERKWPVFRFKAGTPECDWPEVWPPERLAQHRIDLGEVEFGRQMLGIPFGEATDYFDLSAARRCQELCDDPEGWWLGEFDRDQFLWVTAGVDIAASRRAGSALTTFFVLGLDKDGKIKHVLNIRAGRYVGADLLRELVQVHRRFRPNEWAVESNATQAHITDLCTDTEILKAVGATQEEADEIRLRMHAHFTSQQNKNHEIWGVRAMRAGIDAYTWRFPKGQEEIEMLFSEMRTYDPETHTGDRLIGMWIASVRLRGKGQRLALSIRRGGRSR